MNDEREHPQTHATYGLPAPLDELTALTHQLDQARANTVAFRTHYLTETSRLTREVLEVRTDNERLRAAVAPLLKEVIQLRDGLLHPKQGRAIAPDGDSLHWEGVTPVDPRPSEGDKWLAVQWSKVIVPVQQALAATPAPVVPLKENT